MIPRLFSDDQAAEIRRRYDAGETQAELAREFGCSQGTIYKTMSRTGSKPQSAWHRGTRKRGHSARTLAKAKAAKAAAAEGYTAQQIAAAMRLTDKRIFQLLRINDDRTSRNETS